MLSDLKIVFPSALHGTEKNPLSATFVAVGLVRAVIMDDTKQNRLVNVVRASIRHYRPDGTLGPPVQQVQSRQLRPFNNPDLLQWAVFFPNAGGSVPMKVKLTVEAFKKGTSDSLASAHVDLWVNPNKDAIPSVDWPEIDGYIIENEERDF